MTVKEIIANYLKEKGFDGLCAIECGCGLPDIMLCDNDQQRCTPAYAHTRDDCLSCPDFDDCSIDLLDGYTLVYCERRGNTN